MKKNVIIFIVLAGLVTMLAGCEEPLNWDRIKGRQVQFEVSSRSDVKTKTSYSDDFYTEDGRNYERIDWVQNDQIRIYSSNTAKVSSNIGDYYDYSIASVTANDRKSDATLTQPAAGEGLIWVDDPYDVTFYGTYPPMERLYENDNKTLRFFTGMSIPSTQELTWSGRIGKHGMSYAYMVSAPATFQGTEEDGQTVPKMHMDFYPLFNAFYFVLASQDNEIQLNSLTLKSNSLSSYLSGRFNYTVRTLTANGRPTVEGVSHVGDNATSVSVNFPSGTKISKTDSVKVTVLTLPPQSAAISDLTLTINYGDGKVANLPLKYNETTNNGAWLTFPAFHKARITGLAMKGGSKWQLTIDDQVLPWIEDVQTTSFRTNIGISGRSPIYVNPQYGPTAPEPYKSWYAGFVEEDSGKEVTEPKEVGGWPNYYTRLTIKTNVSRPCGMFVFTPTQPIGGYWRLSPEAVIPGSLDYFDITVDDGINGRSSRLQGQVMGQPVYIFIQPTDEYMALDPAPVYSIIIHCDMSPSVTFDPLYSADSEFQRPYSDGRFGYYKFVIAK